MSVTLPAELADLLSETGAQWPQADEDKLHELASSWRRVSTKLDMIGTEGRSVTTTVLDNHEGGSIDAFAARWSTLERHLAAGAEAAAGVATAVDAMAQATLTTKSAIVQILEAGHAQKSQLTGSEGVAFLGPLLRALARALWPYIARLFTQLGQLIQRAIAPLLRSGTRIFREIIDFLVDLFGNSPPTPPPPPPAPLPPPPPVYRRDAPLPPARDLLKHGQEWQQTGRSGGKLPLKAGPNQVYYRRDPATGEITNYSVYDESGYIIKRVDLAGKPHGGVETPHTLDYQLNPNPKTGEIHVGPKTKRPRPAAPEEQP